MPGLQEIEQPTSIRFYNEEREFIGEIDNFTSAVYVRRWETFGNFEIHFTEDRPDLFVPGYYIMINNDRYRNGIIQYYKNDSDGYEPKSLKDIVIKGFSLLYLLYWRLTEPPATNNGYRVWNNKPVEDIMCDLVNEQVVHPVDPARAAKEIRVLQSQHRGIKITFQSRFKYLTDELFELSRQSGLGPVIWLDTENQQFVFEVLEGKDCTHRIDNPNSYIFSKGNGKVTKRTYTYSCEGEKNMAYIGGQGDGDEREVVKINAHLTGLQRKEMFIDARDIAEGETDSLLDRGKLKLSAAAATVSYVFDADTQDYGRSWDLGDLATYVDENGFVEDNRITQVREVYENSVLKIAPTFGYGKQTFVDNLHANTVTMTNERVGISGKFKDLYAENATIKNAIIEKADIKDLNAVTATVETLRAQTAEIQVLVADKASIGDLNAATARITELEADTADIRKAIIDVAHIGDLTAITADITNLKAGIADIDTAMIGKADIDLANIKNGCITTAMIGTGVIGTTQIADGSITDAKIVGLTANKITAGRLDAAQIEVVNLNAANITVGTINGVQIAPGAITGDKLAQQVNDQITGAANTAQQAQTTADGKNKIYYQNTQPGLTGNKKGDTWFDTANGYKAYVWDGTKWSASPFGSGALSDAVNSSITTAGSNASTALANAAAAKTAADQAAKDAQTAQSNASAAKTAADQAAKDLEAAEKNLAAVTGRVDATEEEIAAAQAAVTTAQNKANAAAQAAASAQSTADTAKQNAATAQTKADSAYSLADQAKKAADTAQTSADGKNTVFYQTTQPPTTGRKIGDTWFDTDDGNRIYRWDGSKWAAAQFGTNAIANAAITNAQIADATIQSAKIAALDAGKITTGILSAARIAAGSITADKLASKSITVGQISDAAIKGINDLITIGARNLLRNSGTPTTNTTYGTRVFNTSGLKPNTKYTFVVNGFTSSASQKIGLWFNSGSAGGFFVSPTTTAKTQFVVCTTPATLTTTNVNIYNYPSGSTSCTINWACLYEGEIKPPMDWMPAPEDDTAAIATNSIANWCYNNNLTYINGGKIYTGTVTATQIAANAIIAGKIAANAVTVGTIAAGAVNADKLAANSVNASKIVAGSITAAQLAASTITADKIASGTITATQLATNAVTSDKIVADAITTAKIAAKAVTANEIAAGTITAAQIAANAITATQLAAGAVTAAKIAAGQITADKIAAGAITADKFYGTAITSKNYVANSAGMNINLANGTIDTKNFKVDSSGNVAMTGTLTMQGAQTMTVRNASATRVGYIAFKAVSGQTWSPGALSIYGDGLLHMAAGDANSSKAFLDGYAGGTQLFELSKEGSALGATLGLNASFGLFTTNQGSYKNTLYGNTEVRGTVATTGDIDVSGLRFFKAGANDWIMRCSGIFHFCVGDGGMYVNNYGNSGWKPVYAETFYSVSSEEYKFDINKYQADDAVTAIKNGTIYRYQLKSDPGKQRIGLITERETPKDTIGKNGKSIDVYSMAAINWRATQEIAKQYELLQKQLLEQKQEIALLRAKIGENEMLEGKTKTISINEYSKIGEDRVCQFYANINSETPETMDIGRAIQNQAAYKANRAAVMKDQADFETYAYSVQDEMIAEKNNK